MKRLFVLIFLIISACTTEKQKIINHHSSKSQERQTTSQKEDIKPISSKTINVILPLSKKNKEVGNTILNSIILSYYKSLPKNIKVKFYDSEDNLDIATISNDESEIIIGPVFGYNTKSLMHLDKKTIFTFSNDKKILSPNIVMLGDDYDHEINFITNHAAKNYDEFYFLLPSAQVAKSFVTKINIILSASGKNIGKFYYYDNINNFISTFKTISNDANKTSKKAIFIYEPQNQFKQIIQNLYIEPEGSFYFINLYPDLQKFQITNNKHNFIYYFTENNQKKDFEEKYEQLFASKSNFLSSKAFDIFSIISLYYSQNEKFDINFLKDKEFDGISGKFYFDQDLRLHPKSLIYIYENEKEQELPTYSQ